MLMRLKLPVHDILPFCSIFTLVPPKNYSTIYCMVKFGSSIIQFLFYQIIFENMLVRYLGKIIKVSWRDPGQNGRC